jgi:hypothetical protein
MTFLPQSGNYAGEFGHAAVRFIGVHVARQGYEVVGLDNCNPIIILN